MKSLMIAALALLGATSALQAQDPADTVYNEYKEDIITLPLGVGVRIP